MDADAATVKYAQALPFVLLPVSSQLAALHTARAHADVSAACPRCGADATFQRTRIARSKHPRSSQPTRMVLTTCTACDGVTSTPFQSGTVPSFSVRKRKPIALAVASSQLLVKASSSDVKVAPLPVIDQAPKADKPTAVARENGPPAAVAKLGSSSSKSKKKSSLQQMLECNREKEKHKSKAADAKQPSGLSAFLRTL